MAATQAPGAVSTDRLRSLIREELAGLVGIRHDLHAHPELAYEERRTSGVVQRELVKAGVDFKSGLAGGTGVLAHLPASNGGGAPGAASTGLRADMDALPLVEETGVPYASTSPGTMHACGHDGHTTILIGTARVLAKIAAAEGLAKPVTLLFQPAEEGGGGGRRMVNDGCLDGSVIGPPIARMYGLHGWPRLPLGMVGTRPGPLLAAADKIEIIVRGKGCHAAFPHFGRDPILAGAAIVNAIQGIVSRNVNPIDSAVISVTTFHCGQTFNVIENEARLTGTVRTLTPETQTLVRDRLREIVDAIAKAHGCEGTLNYEIGYPVTRNAPEAVDSFNQAATSAFGADRVYRVPAPFMGAEDFSFYCDQVPSCFFILGLLPKDRKETPDLHQPQFNFNDDAIPIGIEMFCRLAMSG
jgi:amidohydrolase